MNIEDCLYKIECSIYDKLNSSIGLSGTCLENGLEKIGGRLIVIKNDVQGIYYIEFPCKRLLSVKRSYFIMRIWVLHCKIIRMRWKFPHESMYDISKHFSFKEIDQIFDDLFPYLFDMKIKVNINLFDTKTFVVNCILKAFNTKYNMIFSNYSENQLSNEIVIIPENGDISVSLWFQNTDGKYFLFLMYCNISEKEKFCVCGFTQQDDDLTYRIEKSQNEIKIKTLIVQCINSIRNIYDNNQLKFHPKNTNVKSRRTFMTLTEKQLLEQM